MSLTLVLAINSVAALTGSALSYWFRGRGWEEAAAALRHRYIFITPSDIEKTEAFFARRGRVTVLVARFVPVGSHIISIPSGVARIPLFSFLLQTFLGATIWGSFLIMLGYELGERWESVAKQLKQVDLVIGLVIVVAFIALVARFVVRRRRAQLEGRTNNAD